MSIENTLRFVLIGMIVFVVIVGFALDENSYTRSKDDAEAESETVA